MYKIETHLHTTYISHCGWLGAQALMKAYSAAGYAAICVTDHYNRECFDYADIDLTAPGSKTDAFLLGFRRLQREAKNTASLSMKARSFVLMARTTITCSTGSITSCWPILRRP